MKKTNSILSGAIFFLSISSAYAKDSSGFYLEVFGGIAKESTRGSPEPGSATSGKYFTGKSRDVDLDSNKIFGARGGYRVSDNFRFDISYYDASSKLEWMTDFSGCCTSRFTADIDSKIYLLNAYYNFITNTNYSPYLGLGVGQSRNKFKSGKEYFDGKLVLGADLSSNTETALSYRLAVGTDYFFTENLLLNVDLSLMNLGDASSGSSSKKGPIDGHETEKIGAYEFKNIWLSTLTISLKYYF